LLLLTLELLEMRLSLLREKGEARDVLKRVINIFPESFQLFYVSVKYFGFSQIITFLLLFLMILISFNKTNGQKIIKKFPNFFQKTSKNPV